MKQWRIILLAAGGVIATGLSADPSIIPLSGFTPAEIAHTVSTKAATPNGRGPTMIHKQYYTFANITNIL